MKSADSNFTDHPLLEATLESGEAAINLLAGSEILAALPVVSTAFNVWRGVMDLRSRVFMAKLQKFVMEPTLQSEQSRESLLKMASNGGVELHRIGETLFLVLERLTDMDKPPLLAKVFVGYLKGLITSEELRRLAPAIDAAFFEDLKHLIDDQNPGQMDSPPWKRSLAVAGLTEQNVPGPIGGKLIYGITPLGLALRRALGVS